MRALIVHDDGQRRRLDNAIAAFKSRPAMEQSRMTFLLEALQREQAALSSGRQSRAGASLRRSPTDRQAA
jgi:hypothetical protein